jgi:tripartite-type tricarboxylate transporter receptor subunit TctC
MPKNNLALFPAVVAALALAVTPVYAQTYPTKAVRIVTSAPGGGSDVVSRLLALGLTSTTGQQFLVDNRGGGVVAGETVSKSAPDGYTLLYYGSALWLLPLMRKDVPYDPMKDFVPISWVSRQPNLLVVHPSLPAKNAREFIALIKARPGQLNYSAGGTGSSGHMAAELFKYMTKVDIVRINYKGQGPATNDLVAGQVQMTFGTSGAVSVHVKSGRLRALAVTSSEPSALAPGLPTLTSSGVPGYEYEQMSGLFAPTKTPPAVLATLSQEVAKTLSRQEVKDRVFQSGAEIVAGSPERFGTKIREEVARMDKVIKAAGIQDQ